MSDPFGYCGSNNGEFGFPFRFTAGTPDDTHPFTSTLGALLRLYWGVKDWTLDTDLKLIATTGTFSMPNGVIPLGSPPADKYGLLLGSNKASGTPCNWERFNPSTGPGVGSNLVLWSMYGGSPRMTVNGGSFYPYFDVPNANVGDDTAIQSVILSSDSAGTATVSGNLKLGGGFPDIPFPLYYVLNGSPLPSFTMSKFDFSPAALW